MSAKSRQDAAGARENVYGETFYVSVERFAGEAGRCSGCLLEFSHCVRAKVRKTIKDLAILGLLDVTVSHLLVGRIPTNHAR